VTESRRTPRPRRQRSLTESLLSIVLALEAVLVFFVALTVFGLHALPAVAAFSGGAVLVVLLGVTTRIVRYSWGVWVGWALQVALLATGIVLPVLYVVAAVFVAMWIFCFVRARQIDRANSIDSTPTEGQTP
jgi:Protein of unknown function (DUF4233)